ncbi:MAG: hypothetical protein MJ072_00380, partial [Clostridia bacterium]|nr:hypothetical protein [Clostridia bacterium]
MIKRSYRSTIKILSFVMVVLLLLSAVGSTVAWFVQSNKVSIKTEDDVKLAVEVSNLEISISVDDEQYTGYTSAQTLTAEASLADISGNGSKLYYPNYLVNQDQAPDVPLAWLDIGTAKNPEKYLISLKIKFKTKAKMDVYLSTSSSILPKGFTVGSGGVHTWDGTTQKSKNGNFSLGGIAGAARVAFLSVEDDVETLETVWVPNPDYCLNESTTSFEITSDKAKREKFNGTDYPYGYIDLSTGGVVHKPDVWGDYANKNVTIGRA